MESSSKKHKSSPDTAGPESMFSLLKAEVPHNTFKVLAGLAEHYEEGGAFPYSLQKYEETALQSARKAFAKVRSRLEAEALDAHSELKCVEAGWVERSSKLESAQAELAKIKHDISQAKLDIKASAKAIESARLEVQKRKAAEKKYAGNAKLVFEKIKSLQAVEHEDFQPLKQASVKGARGKKKVKHLCKVGKQFGFHDVLVSKTMPQVALKSIDRRQTFDKLVLDQMEAEFAKKKKELEEALNDETASQLDRQAAVQTAENDLADAQAQRDVNATRLAEAEKSLSLCKESLEAARQDSRKFHKYSQKIVRENAQFEARLSNFLDGPFDAFRKLEVFLLPPCALAKLPSRQEEPAEIRTGLTRALTRIATFEERFDRIDQDNKRNADKEELDEKKSNVDEKELEEQKSNADEEELEEKKNNAEEEGALQKKIAVALDAALASGELAAAFASHEALHTPSWRNRRVILTRRN
jgi:hypothetical protein